SFVSSKAIPQLADAAEAFAAVEKKPTTSYAVLVPNLRGMDRAIAAGVREIAVFTAASQSFTRPNINMTIDRASPAFRPVAELARQHGIRARGYISTAFGCPYEGAVAPQQVVAVTQKLLDLGIEEISIGDTIGVATPNQVADLVPLLAEHTSID